MTKNKGFQAIPRTWFGSVQWQCKRTFNHLEALIWLLEQAAYVDGRRVQLSEHKSITLRRGQIVTTLSAIAERWGWDKSTVSRFLRQYSQGGAFEYAPVIATETIRCAKSSTTKYGASVTLITLCNYDEISNLCKADATVGATVSATVDATVSATSIYSIETKNKESYKERENECVEKEKKVGTRTHTLSQKFDNHLVSTTDCVGGAAHGICDGSKIAAERAAKPMKSVDDLSQEKENVAPKEKEGGTAGNSARSGAGTAIVGTPTRQTATGTATATATRPAESAMFAVPGATERETAQGGELLRWFRTTYPDLAAMQYPMTLEQAVWLLRSYSLPDIRFVIDRMRSKEAFRTNTAFYSTFIAFARRDKDIVRRDAQKVYRV